MDSSGDKDTLFERTDPQTLHNPPVLKEAVVLKAEGCHSVEILLHNKSGVLWRSSLCILINKGMGHAVVFLTLAQ